MSAVAARIWGSQMLRLITFVWLLSSTTRVLSADAQENQQTRLLTGGVSHSESLPPLPDSVQAGQVFSGFQVNLTRDELANETAAAATSALPAGGQTKASSAVHAVTTPKTTAQGAASRNQLLQRSAALSQQKAAGAVPPPRVSSPLKGNLAAVQPPSKNRPSAEAIKAALSAYAGQRNLAGVAPSISQPRPSAQQSGFLRSQNAQSASGLSQPLRGSANQQRFALKEKNFKIPAWLAGVWQRSESNEIGRVLADGKQLKPAGHSVANVKDRFGTFRDQSGQIWQVFDPRQATGSIDRGSAVDHHTVTGYDIVLVGNYAAVVVVRAAHAIVNKSTHRISQSFQDEELNTYSKMPDGRLRTDSSVKVFDGKGKPQLLTRAISMEVRIAPFSGPLQSGVAGAAQNRLPDAFKALSHK